MISSTYCERLCFQVQNNNKADSDRGNWDRIFATWISAKNLPILFFDDKPTQLLFKKLNVDAPRRNKMTGIVVTEFLRMQSTVKRILGENGSKFSFNVDGWSAKNFDSYYGITVHFIDKEWLLTSLALDLVQSHGKHAGKKEKY